MIVFHYELLRTSRRGRPALVRGVYSLALLIALGGVFVRWFGAGPLALDQILASGPRLPPRDLARFAREFTDAFLFVQLGAVLLLTPAFAAGAIAEERQRGTLDDLLVTDLSAAAIVLGKLVARWVHVAGVLLTGLPVLALAQLWGGIDVGQLLAGFTVTALTSLTLTALSLFCSVRERTVGTAVIITYLLVGIACTVTTCLPLVWFANPLLVMAHLAEGLRYWPAAYWALGVFALWHVALIVLLAGVAVLRLRGGDNGPAPRPADVPEATHVPIRLIEPPPVGESPLLWKEVHFGGDRSAGPLFRAVGFVFGSAVVVIGLGELIPRLVTRGSSPQVRAEVDIAFRGLIAGVGAMMMLRVGVFAAGSVCRERERRTLDNLCLLPDGPVAVLRAKWFASLLRVRWLAVGLGAFVLFGALAGALRLGVLGLVPLAAVCHLTFLASLGLWVSVRLRGTARATFAVLATLLGLAAGPLLAVDWTAPPIADTSRSIGRLVAEGLSPPMAWWRLTRPPDEWPPATIDAALLGLAGYAAVGHGLWRRAERRFAGSLLH